MQITRMLASLLVGEGRLEGSVKPLDGGSVRGALVDSVSTPLTYRHRGRRPHHRSRGWGNLGPESGFMLGAVTLPSQEDAKR